MPATSILQKKTNDPSKEGNKVFSKLLPQYHLGFAMVQEEFFTKLVLSCWYAINYLSFGVF